MCSPSTSRSSPTFPITVTPAGSVASTSPRRKRAPPTPPESATTFLICEGHSPGMDVPRFAAELPGLFEDSPRSREPRGRRFDDILAVVPNLAAENNLALINLAVSLLEPGEIYVEAGTFMG